MAQQSLGCRALVYPIHPILLAGPIECCTNTMNGKNHHLNLPIITGHVHGHHGKRFVNGLNASCISIVCA